MQETARVIAIEGELVRVVPLEIEACINCSNSACKANGNVFEVANRRGFDIHVGSEVRVGASIGDQVLQGLFSLGLPASAAGLAWYVAKAFSGGETLAVCAALGALALTAAIVALVLRRRPPALPEIREVL